MKGLASLRSRLPAVLFRRALGLFCALDGNFTMGLGPWSFRPRSLSKLYGLFYKLLAFPDGTSHQVANAIEHFLKVGFSAGSGIAALYLLIQS